MDGPSDNIKMQRYLANERSAEIQDAPSLINIGVCNLHVVHGAFCTGLKVTGWKLDDVFKAMYSFFKNTYKRRTDFVEVTGTGMFNFIVNQFKLLLLTCLFKCYKSCWTSNQIMKF